MAEPLECGDSTPLWYDLEELEKRSQVTALQRLRHTCDPPK